VDAALSARRKSLGEITNAYAAAADASPLPPPGAPGEGAGYMMVLEQQLADKYPDFIEFQRVLSGG
jgi:hypothetical protein